MLISNVHLFNYNSYDSKKHINIVGIHNAGATGYLIVLLQLLFFTNYFRKIIYETPAKPNSVLAALQSLFYQLQSSSKAVGNVYYYFITQLLLLYWIRVLYIYQPILIELFTHSNN